MRTLAEIVPLRTSACREAEGAIVTIAAGEPEVDHAAARHVGTCLRCQAEVAAYRRVMAVMRTMRDDRFALPDGALGEMLRSMGSMRSGRAGELYGGPAPRGAPGGAANGNGGPLDGAAAWAVRAVYVGGLTAAGAAGFLMWISRRRLGFPEAS